MFAPDQYQLVDFGHGKKLERFAGVEVLRDCPAAQGVQPHDPSLLRSPRVLTYSRETGRWQRLSFVSAKDWFLSHGSVKLGLKPTPFGHLGVFCEQATNWSWLDSIATLIAGRRALNLFAYTGGTTLKLAELGASVVHVDAAGNIVNWARENARRSGLADRPIRWIVDDALSFVHRELRRGNEYDILVADPPAFGHGGKRASWKLTRDLPVLIRRLADLCNFRPTVLLLTWHSRGVEADQLSRAVASEFLLHSRASVDRGNLDLTADDGRTLNCGHFVRWYDLEKGKLSG